MSVRIESLDDVLPAISGREDFLALSRDGYTVVDYVFALPDSFDCPIRRECRGIKFDDDGKILARPFHKFFNIGEREETLPHALDFQSPHLIMQKLDGSMVHPAFLKGDLVFMTRKGVTDVSVRAEQHIGDGLRRWCADLIAAGITPIFEYTSPDNRIVVRYDHPRITLLAARHTRSGAYLGHDELRDIAIGNIVETIPSSWPSGAGFLEFVAPLKDAEGFVVRFKSGLWVKAKAEDYVLKHKSKSGIYLEKNALALVLAGGVDDVLPLLSEDEADILMAYQADVLEGIGRTVDRLVGLVESGASLDQKTFAVSHLAGVEKADRALAFQIRAGADPQDAVRAAIQKSLRSQSAVDQARPLYEAQWRLEASSSLESEAPS